MKNIYNNQKSFKFLRTLCAFIVFAFILNTAVFAVPTPEKIGADAVFSISNPVKRVETGDVAYANIAAKGLPQNIFGYELCITYDETRLTYKGVKTADNNAVKAEKTESGSVRIAFVSGIRDKISIGGSLASVEFYAKKSGQAYITLNSAVVIDTDMKYSEYFDMNNGISVNILSKQVSGGGSSGGGGGGGSGLSTSGGISIVGGSNTVGVVSPTVIPAPQTPEPLGGFNDLNGSEWAVQAIEGLRSLGVLNGYDDGGFHPSDSVTRAEFCKIVCSSLGLLTPSDVSSSGFYDVAVDEWYAPYIIAAKSAGIINGYEDGSFSPDGDIQREEAAAVLGRAVENTEYINAQLRLNINFADEYMISDYAAGYVDRLYTMSIINGDENNMFRPQDSISRAETAQIIWNILSLNNSSAEASAEPENETDSIGFKSARMVYSADESAVEPNASSSAEAEEMPSDAPLPDNSEETSLEPSVEPSTEPMAEPSEVPSETPSEVPSEIPSQEPTPSFVPDKVLECESLSELGAYSNIFAYLIPDDGSREAFYDDFTTFQRSGDGDAYAVFCIPYLTEAEIVGYFYAGEELSDFKFETSVDGENWSVPEVSKNYLSAEGKWTRADYSLNTDCSRYLKIIYPETVNWWTPLISKVSAKTAAPSAKEIKIDGNDTLVIPRFDSAEYKFNAYVVDEIGEPFEGEVKFLPGGDLPIGVTVSEDGTVIVSSDAEDKSSVKLKAVCSQYNLSAEINIVLASALLGDLNADGVVDNVDLDSALLFFAKDSLSSDWMDCRECDVNTDGVINVIDISYIAMASYETLGGETQNSADEIGE